MSKVYIAGGWFTPDQKAVLEQIIEVVKESGIDFYSPKDDFLYDPGVTDPQEVFNENVAQIMCAPFIIASTEGKDMGTIFECGYASSLMIPIIYVWIPKYQWDKFNIMLSQSGRAILTSIPELREYLGNYVKTRTLPFKPVEAPLE